METVGRHKAVMVGVDVQVASLKELEAQRVIKKLRASTGTIGSQPVMGQHSNRSFPGFGSWQGGPNWYQPTVKLDTKKYNHVEQTNRNASSPILAPLTACSRSSNNGAFGPPPRGTGSRTTTP